MKKILLILGICAVSLSCTANQANFHKYYLGVDAQALTLKPEEFPDASNSARAGYSGFVGYRWRAVGLEVGVTGIESKNYSTTNSLTNYTGTSKAYNMYIDALFFKALNEKLDLKGLLGYGFLQTKFNMQDNPTTFRYEETALMAGLRFGIGLQYSLSKRINASLMYKGQFTTDSYSNINAAALSLAYVFC